MNFNGWNEAGNLVYVVYFICFWHLIRTDSRRLKQKDNNRGLLCLESIHPNILQTASKGTPTWLVKTSLLKDTTDSSEHERTLTLYSPLSRLPRLLTRRSPERISPSTSKNCHFVWMLGGCFLFLLQVRYRRLFLLNWPRRYPLLLLVAAIRAFCWQHSSWELNASV